MRKSDLKVAIKRIIREVSDDDMDQIAQQCLYAFDEKHNRKIITQMAHKHGIEDKELFAYIKDLLEDEDEVENMIVRLIGKK